MTLLLFLYVVSLHVSIAGMETASSILIVLAAVLTWQRGRVMTYGRWWIPYLVLVGACAMSLFLNPGVKPFWVQFGFVRFGLVLWALATVLDALWSPEFERRLGWVWLFAMSVAGAFAVFQSLTGIDLIRPQSGAVEYVGGVWRGCGFFSLSLTFAYSIGISLFGASYFGRNPLSWAALALGALGLLASMSRGAWLAFVLCVFVYVVMERRKWLVPVLAGFTAAIVGLFFFAEGFRRKIDGLIHFKIDHSSEMRWHLWQGYWAMFRDHPFWGVGMFQGDRFLPAYYERLGIVEPFKSHAHNNFLQFLAGTGVVGFSAYVALVSYFLLKAWRLRGRSAWAWPLLLAQLFLHIGGLTEANFVDGEVNHMLMWTWALVLVMDKRHER